jgi:hypothetical protein
MDMFADLLSKNEFEITNFMNDNIGDLLNEVLNQKNLKERIAEASFDIYDYNKYDSKNGKRITGKAFDISKVEDLAVVDIDFKKELPKPEKNKIRQDVVDKINLNGLGVGLVETANGGLHIYCGKDYLPTQKNSNVKVYSCSDYDIDLFVALDKKLCGIVLPGSKVKSRDNEKIVEYKSVGQPFDNLYRLSPAETVF